MLKQLLNKCILFHLFFRKVYSKQSLKKTSLLHRHNLKNCSKQVVENILQITRQVFCRFILHEFQTYPRAVAKNATINSLAGIEYINIDFGAPRSIGLITRFIFQIFISEFYLINLLSVKKKKTSIFLLKRQLNYFCSYLFPSPTPDLLIVLAGEQFWNIINKIIVLLSTNQNSVILSCKCYMFIYLLQLTYADILYYSSIEACLYKESKEGVPSALDGFPLLKDLYDRVANNPGIKEWVKKRPDTPL